MISTDVCSWNPKRGELKVASEFFAGSFPAEVELKSAVSGKVVKFRPIPYGHRLYDEDQYDGEAMAYLPDETGLNVKVLYIYHEW